jgi:hypothetical protein
MMKRPRPTAKHSYRDIYAQALSYAFFTRNKDDEDRVYKALLRRKFQPSEIRRLLLKNNNYSSPRVRRVLRPPLVLAAWLEAIFNAFGPLRCSKTRKPLLPPKERNKAIKVVEAIKAGYICDLEGHILSPALSCLGLYYIIVVLAVISTLFLFFSFLIF